MAAPQSAQNHTRWDPVFHFFLAPVLLINLVESVIWCVHHFGIHPRAGIWYIVMSLALFLLAGTMRRYSLTVQDRVIRLEERLRLAALAPAAEFPLLQNLTIPQYVALRFASDAEVPALALHAAQENLTPKQIKASISTWRPDDHRV